MNADIDLGEALGAVFGGGVEIMPGVVAFGGAGRRGPMKQKPVLDSFMSRGQSHFVRSLMRGEEKEWFKAKVAELQAVVNAMPVTGETNAQGENAVAHLHYFMGGVDVWLTELDAGSPEDLPSDYQSQAYGLTDIGFGPELGYISLPEILEAGLELDFHFKPVAVAEIKARKEKAA